MPPIFILILFFDVTLMINMKNEKKMKKLIEFSFFFVIIKITLGGIWP